MKFSVKALVGSAAAAVLAAAGWWGVHVYMPDGVYEDDTVVVKIYDNQECKVDALKGGGAKHATVESKTDDKKLKACYVEASNGLMIFVTEGGGMAMAHRSMFQ